MTDAETLIALMTPDELDAFRRLGGTVPRGLVPVPPQWSHGEPRTRWHDQRQKRLARRLMQDVRARQVARARRRVA